MGGSFHGELVEVEDTTDLSPVGVCRIGSSPIFPTKIDTEKYALWIQENIEDERFNHIYMQGHSHVNMGTSPSSVDLNHQEEILGMLGDDDFYIFMIWNKSLASTNKIYDLKKNVMFEDKDITVKIVGQSEGLDEFIKPVLRAYSSRCLFLSEQTKTRSATAEEGGLRG